MDRRGLDGCNELCIAVHCTAPGPRWPGFKLPHRSLRAQSRAIDVKLDEGSITVTNFWATPYFPPPHLFPPISLPFSFFSPILVFRLHFCYRLFLSLIIICDTSLISDTLFLGTLAIHRPCCEATDRLATHPAAFIPFTFSFLCFLFRVSLLLSGSLVITGSNWYPPPVLPALGTVP